MIHGASKLRLVALALGVSAALGSVEALQPSGGRRAHAAIVPPTPPSGSTDGAGNIDRTSGNDGDRARPWLVPNAEGQSAAALFDAQILDLDDKPVSLRAMRGKLVVVLHQDRYSSEQNQGFKDRLGQLVLRYPDRLQLIALAEAGGYNFWPARRYVKDALRPLRDLGGALVACDWKGAVQRSYRIPARQSAVFVVGKDGALQALRVGTLPAADAAALLSRIEKLAEQ